MQRMLEDQQLPKALQNLDVQGMLGILLEDLLQRRMHAFVGGKQQEPYVEGVDELYVRTVEWWWWWWLVVGTVVVVIGSRRSSSSG